MNSNPAESARSNPAVAHCWEAGKTAHSAALAEGKDEPSAQRVANQAFRAALPPLKGIRNTRNFIACVTFGTLMGLIDSRDSSRLLYAAQVAWTTRGKRNRRLSHSGAIKDRFSANQEPSFPPGFDLEAMKNLVVASIRSRESA